MPGPAENACDQRLARWMSEISEVKCSGYSDLAGAQGKQQHTTEGMKDTSEPPQLTNTRQISQGWLVECKVSILLDMQTE